MIQPGQKLDRLACVDGDFADWVLWGMGLVPVRIDRVRVDLGAELPSAGLVRGVVVTGSPAMVTDDAPWIRRTADWLREVGERGVPTLGICFGHQLIAKAFGGVVDYNPEGLEVGTTALRLTSAAASDPLLMDLPSEPPVHVSHWQAVLEPPPGATVLAETAADCHHAFRIGSAVWGLQFHPEFTPTIIAAYREHHSERIGPGALGSTPHLNPVGESEVGSLILRRFKEQFASEARDVESDFRIAAQPA